MRPMIVKQLDYDLTPVAGLSLVGHLLKSIWPVFKRVDAALPSKGGWPIAPKVQVSHFSSRRET